MGMFNHMTNPDKRNSVDPNYNVRVYFTSNAEHTFPARDLRNAREIAKRVVTEGVWIINDDSEEFYPIAQIYKVKVLKI